MNKKYIITILGSSGGLAKGLLSLLNKSIVDSDNYIYLYLKNSEIHLIDVNQKEIMYYEKEFKHLAHKLHLYEFDLKDTDKFKHHLINTKTDIVIDVSWADTIEMLECCDELGVAYINTALENYEIDENPVYWGYGTSARNEFFEDIRSDFKDITAIIGSGMNPGIVQWMAIELIRKDPQKPNGCYIVEHDTTFFKDIHKCDKDTIYTSWSPECFLDETIDSYPMFIRNKIQYLMYKKVYEEEFIVSLGDKIFSGYLVPHEEVISLGSVYDFESGFIYRVNEHTTNLIKKNIDDLDVLWEKPMELLDPSKYILQGDDLVGVLLVYNDKEVYMYNTCNNEKAYDEYGINATYLQVASGVYASLCTLLLDDIPQGIYSVDKLLLETNSLYGKYVSYYLKEFISGENNFSQGLLENRIVK